MPPDIQAPFTIHEAEFALYPSDAQGNTGTAAYIGGRLESLEPDFTYAGGRMDRHGDPMGAIHQEEEQHQLTIGNLWVQERAPGQRMPRMARNQRYVLVVRWVDPESQVWCKRTYEGVTFEGQKLPSSSQVVMQDLRLVAQQMWENAGRDTEPDLLPWRPGLIRYVDAFGAVDLYRYDTSSQVLEVVDAGLLAGRAEIAVGAELEISFDGDVVLRADESGVEVETLTAVGGAFPVTTSAIPRLVFYCGAVPVAALTAEGELCVPSCEEAEEDPQEDDRAYVFEVTGGWALTLARAGAYAVEFIEGGP